MIDDRTDSFIYCQILRFAFFAYQNFSDMFRNVVEHLDKFAQRDLQTIQIAKKRRDRVAGI
jgi:hypothetical protein